MSTVKINNIKPKATWIQNFTISPDTSIQNFILETTNNLSHNDCNIISYITTSFDTSAIQNITKSEIIVLDGVNTIIEAGFYDRVFLIGLLDLDIPLSGPKSFHTKLNKSITFNQGSELIFLLGFEYQSDNQSFIFPVTFPVASISKYVFDETNGKNAIIINCDLVSSNAPSGGSSGIQYLNVDVPIGTFISRRIKINQNIIRKSHNSVQFILNDKFNRPYTVATPISITLEFAIY